MQLQHMWTIICLLTLLHLLGMGNPICVSVPLSLSNLDNCNNGRCIFTDTIQFKMDLLEGNEFCVRLSLDNSNSNQIDLTIKLINYWVEYPTVNCYLSDDPKPIVKAVCGCNLVHKYSCNECPLSFGNSSSSYCMEGIAASSGCLSSGPGTFCSKIKFNGGSRYQVCDIGRPLHQLHLKINSGNKSIEGIIDGNHGSIISDSFNLTMVTLNHFDSLYKEKYVFDTFNPESPYIVPNSLLNQYNTKNPTLPGWWRPEVTDYSFMNYIQNIYFTNCNTDSFKYSNAAGKFSNLLDDGYELQRLYPSSIDLNPLASSYQDSFEDRKNSVPSNVTYVLSTANKIYPISLVHDKFPYDELTLVPRSMTTACGVISSPLCSKWIHTFFDETGSYYIAMCKDGTTGSCWGICRKFINRYQNVTDQDCTTGGTLPLTLYPSMQTGLFNCNYQGCYLKELYYQKNASTAQGLAIQSYRDSAVISFTVPEIMIQFVSENVIPRIIKVRSTEDSLIFTATSTGAEGNCVTISTNDIFSSIMVFLTSSEKQFVMKTVIRNYSGKDTLKIQCYQYSDQVSYDVSVKKSNPDIKIDSISNDEIREASLDLTFWETFFYYLLAPISLITDLYGGLPNTWLGFIITWIIVLIVIVIIIGLIIYLKSFCFLLCLCCRKRERNSQSKRIYELMKSKTY